MKENGIIALARSLWSELLGLFWIKSPLRMVVFEPTGAYHRAFEHVLYQGKMPFGER
ncbi:hypothetical protein ROLI_021810 [Roseobacter fucihabitans]|uniref:Uncharacterized protein n=1 Tax=Roseobacter fucihabitans TaxID=1537242 RepID=A0ABZ2BUF3_9RHOB|nr:hypothetical protein [Roseobacter litoralis]